MWFHDFKSLAKNKVKTPIKLVWQLHNWQSPNGGSFEMINPYK